ncbi:MAG: hypothetical protein WC556_12140 [Candidatus Methanoperedens sp.]
MNLFNGGIIVECLDKIISKKRDSVENINKEIKPHDSLFQNISYIVVDICNNCNLSFCKELITLEED